MTFTPTPEQIAVVEAASGKDSVMAVAYAGCAKSSTSALAAQRIKVPALSLAFNKKIAEDTAKRFPGNFSVKTLNGLGYGAWMRAHPGVTFAAPDGRKLGKLVSKLARDWKIELDSDQWEACRKLVEGAMLNGIVPGDGGMPLFADTEESWHCIADELLMTEGDFGLMYHLAHEVLKESIELGRSGVMSFDDQVYLPTVLGGKFPKFPVIFGDEAQDWNRLNHRMVELCMRDDARLVIVGDPLQSIYQFRGAHNDSMGQIKALHGRWTDLPLATTFRCPKSIVERQQGHAPGFRAFHTNAEGRFHSMRPVTDGEELEWEGWGVADLMGLLPTPNSTIAVLCRNNGPLLSLAFKLLRGGTGVVMLGRDIGKGLIALSRKLCPEDGTPAVIVAGVITDWLESESSLAVANGHDEKVAGLTDRAECLRAVLGSAGVSDAGGLRLALDKLFARDNGRITLGSIHRSKGLEWDVVVMLDPWRIPSKWAKEASLRGDKRQLQQEYNLRYVGETRTKHTLANANLEDFNG